MIYPQQHIIIWSYIKTGLFITFCLVAGYPALSSARTAQPSGTAVTARPEITDSLYRYSLQINSGYRMPLLDAGQIWKPYTFAGIGFEIPAVAQKYPFIFTLDGGLILPKDRTLPEILIFQTRLGLARNIKLPIQLAGIRPIAGISNTTIYIFDSFELNAHVFGSTENEFGFFTGFEPSLFIRKLRISLPIYGNYTFSSPIPFVTFTVSLSAWMTF